MMGGEFIVMDGVVNNNPAEEMLGLQMMIMQQQQQADQQRQLEQQRQQQLAAQQLAAERARQEQVRQQQLAEQRRQEELRKQHQYQQNMGQGNAYMNAQQFSQAIGQYNLALRDYPTDINPKFSIACCYQSMGDIQSAYAGFMELAQHGAQISEMPTHITQCETILMNNSLAHITQAKKLYSGGSIDESINELNTARALVPKGSHNAQGILQQIHELTNRIHWDQFRDGINARFDTGLKALGRQEYSTAVECFTTCQSEYAQNVAFLHDVDQANKNALGDLLQKSNRGVEQQANVRYQNNINSLRPTVGQALVNFNLAAAIKALESIIVLYNKITRTDDVIDLGYLPLNDLQQSLTTLKDLLAEFESRKRDESLRVAQQIAYDVDNLKRISDTEKAWLQTEISAQLKKHWHNLDGRNLNALIAGIVEIAQQHIEKYGCLSGCFASAPFYIVDSEILSDQVDDYINNNIPQDIRQPLDVPLFTVPEPDIMHKSLLFSQGILVAQVVNPDTYEENANKGAFASATRATIL